MNDKAREAADEVVDFWKNEGAYSDLGFGDQSAVVLFLERNYVVRLPELGEMVVTEKRGPSGGLQFLINGKVFASNQDLFYWQKSVSDWERLVENRQEALRFALTDLAKRLAVLAFLTDKQAKETQYESERQARRDALVQQYFPANSQWDQLFPWSQGLIDRVIDAEDARDAVKP